MRGNSLIGIITGVTAASIGGMYKYVNVLSNNPPEWSRFGILLPSAVCLLVPLMGGFMGWVGAFVANKISNFKNGDIIGGILGGLLGSIITTLLLIPFPSGL